MRNSFGTVLAGPPPVTLQPGRAFAIGSSPGAGVDAWCSISVKGGKSSVRGNLNLDSDTITLLESVPLQ